MPVMTTKVVTVRTVTITDGKTTTTEKTITSTSDEAEAEETLKAFADIQEQMGKMVEQMHKNVADVGELLNTIGKATK